MLFEAVFETSADANWDEAESCLVVLRQRSVGRELAELQRKIAATPMSEELSRLQAQRLELQRKLVGLPDGQAGR